MGGTKKNNSCLLFSRKPSVKNKPTMYKGITIGTKRIAIPSFVKTSLFAGTAFMPYADATKGVADGLLWFGSPSMLIGGTAAPFAGNTWPIGNGTLFVGNGTLFIDNGTLPDGNKVLPVDNTVLCTGMGARRYHGKPTAVYRIAMSFPAVPLLKDSAADPEGNGALPFSFVVLLPGKDPPVKRNGDRPNGNVMLSDGTTVLPDSTTVLPDSNAVWSAYIGALSPYRNAVSFDNEDKS